MYLYRTIYTKCDAYVQYIGIDHLFDATSASPSYVSRLLNRFANGSKHCSLYTPSAQKMTSNCIPSAAAFWHEQYIAGKRCHSAVRQSTRPSSKGKPFPAVAAAFELPLAGRAVSSIEANGITERQQAGACCLTGDACAKFSAFLRTFHLVAASRTCTHRKHMQQNNNNKSEEPSEGAVDSSRKQIADFCVDFCCELRPCRIQ